MAILYVLLKLFIRHNVPLEAHITRLSPTASSCLVHVRPAPVPAAMSPISCASGSYGYLLK